MKKTQSRGFLSEDPGSQSSTPTPSGAMTVLRTGSLHGLRAAWPAPQPPPHGRTPAEEPRGLAMNSSGRSHVPQHPSPPEPRASEPPVPPTLPALSRLTLPPSPAPSSCPRGLSRSGRWVVPFRTKRLGSSSARPTPSNLPLSLFSCSLNSSHYHQQPRGPVGEEVTIMPYFQRNRILLRLAGTQRDLKLHL